MAASIIRLIVLAILMTLMMTARAQYVSGSSTSGKSSAIKEALADSIRLRAEANKEKVLAKHGGQQAAPAAVPEAKTKSFAYTSIQIPGTTA